MNSFCSLHGSQRWHLLGGQQGPGKLFSPSGLGALSALCVFGFAWVQQAEASYCSGFQLGCYHSILGLLQSIQKSKGLKRVLESFWTLASCRNVITQKTKPSWKQLCSEKQHLSARVPTTAISESWGCFISLLTKLFSFLSRAHAIPQA